VEGGSDEWFKTAIRCAVWGEMPLERGLIGGCVRKI